MDDLQVDTCLVIESLMRWLLLGRRLIVSWREGSDEDGAMLDESSTRPSASSSTCGGYEMFSKGDVKTIDGASSVKDMDMAFVVAARVIDTSPLGAS